MEAVPACVFNNVRASLSCEYWKSPDESGEPTIHPHCFVLLNGKKGYLSGGALWQVT